MKLVGDMSKACKDTVDAKSLSRSRGGWKKHMEEKSPGC